MQDQSVWSVGVGSWHRVRIRLHMFFLLFAAFTFYLSWLEAHRPDARGQVWVCVASLVILLASVVVHELGHLIVAHRLGTHVDEVILGPFGGLGPLPTGLEPHSEMVMAVAGPLANLGVCLMSAFCLTLRGGVILTGLMDPLAPTDVMVGDALMVVMKLTFWVNWLLAVINLVPAFPFDGGRLLRAGLMLMRHPMDFARAVLVVARVAKVTSLVLLLFAYFARNQNPAYLVQTWFALVLLAILIYFCARKEESILQQANAENSAFDYDFSEGYTSLERAGAKVSTVPLTRSLVRWWQRRKEFRERRQRELEVSEENRVDEILARLHEVGMENLSTDERGLLQRVSARYRSRPHRA